MDKTPREEVLYGLINEKDWDSLQTGFHARVGDDVPLHKVWLQSRYREQYAGIVLAPTGGKPAPDGYYNLWAGKWAVEPRRGTWRKFQEHLYYIICQRDKANYDYLRKWIAYKLQNPGKKIGVAIVLRGDKGAGKTIVAEYLKRIFGTHLVQISQQKHLLGNFNAHLEHALLVDAEEAFWAGNKRDEGVLKDLITGNTLLIERKGVDAYPARNLLDVMITSNSDWTVPASHDERRFFVLDVSNEKVRDYPYFAAIWKEMGELGPSTLLFDLLSEDLNGFEIKDVPDTDAMRQQKEISMQSHERFVLDVAREGRIPGMDEQLRVVTKDLYKVYQSRTEAYSRTERTVVDVIFSKLLIGLGCDKAQSRIGGGNPVRMLKFPTLSEFRERVEGYFRGKLGEDWTDQAEWSVLVEVVKKGNLDFDPEAR